MWVSLNFTNLDALYSDSDCTIIITGQVFQKSESLARFVKLLQRDSERLRQQDEVYTAAVANYLSVDTRTTYNLDNW